MNDIILQFIDLVKYAYYYKYMKDEDKKSIKLATTLGEKADETQIVKMEEKLPSMKKGPIANIWDKVIDIYEGFKSDETPNSLKLLLIGALLYLVLPIDIVPDMIPVGGLLDDATVLTYVWTKLSKIAKLGAKITKPLIEDNFNMKIQESIKFAYNKAFDFAKNKLEEILKKQANKVIKNSIISLALFIVSIIFLSYNTKESVLISSLILVFLVLKSLFTFFKNLPKVIKIIKIFFKEKDIDSTIEVYLKNSYSFITPIEEFKNKLNVFDDVPDFKELITLQRKALRKTIIEVIITIVLAVVLAFIFRRILIFNSSYNFIQLIQLPFTNLINIFR